MPENFNNTHDIDLVDFSPNKEMEEIRKKEALEREKRRLRAAQLRRAERLRRRRIEQIKQTVFAWGILIFALIAVIAVVVGIVSMFDRGEENKEVPVVGEAVSEEQTHLLNSFLSSKVTVFEDGNGAESLMPYLTQMSAELVPAALDAQTDAAACGSELALLTEAYIWNGALSDVEKIRNTVRDFPMYSNGYIWTTEKSMKSPVTKSYFYDTNAAFISAVSDICLWEGSTAFLEETDMTGEASGDKSAGMKVGEKLDAVVSHFFDSDDYLNGGGVRYNSADGLVYVLTTDNNGGASGKPSNLFYNYRFGYLDTYNNIAFNCAMRDLSALYTLAGDKEKAQRYKNIADVNKNAINEKLYDKKAGRYVGYIDTSGVSHDYGFTALNLMAVSCGIADDEQSESILSWISGERKAGSDSVAQMNALKSGILPVFNTVKADEQVWDSLSGEYVLGENVQFGKHAMNGGASALSGSYYLIADEKSASEKAEKLVVAYKNGSFALPAENDTESPLCYALCASNAVRQMFGLSTDGKTLSIIPSLAGENAGLCDIAFSNNKYDILFHSSGVYVLSDYEEAVRLRIGSFASESDVVLTTVDDGKIVSTETLKADEKGVVSLSKKLGNDVYIRLEQAPTEE